MLEQTASISYGRDRRSPARRNRLRRFLNDYWLVPMMIFYLQLSTQFFFPSDPPLERLYKGNRAFLQGIPIAYQIATYEFPYTLIGHLYEMGGFALYRSNLYQVSHDDLRRAFDAPEVRQAIYDRLIASRADHRTEAGGILSLSYENGRPAVHFHEVPSLNKEYSNRLHSASGSFPEFVALLTHSDLEIFEKVGIDRSSVQNTLALIKNEKLPENIRRTLVENFVEMYDALSESRYLLSPYQYKEAIAKIGLGERLIGLYHFHNGMEEPPSSVDVEQSIRKRQIVLTLSQEGWILYDVVREQVRPIHLKVDKKASLQ